MCQEISLVWKRLKLSSRSLSLSRSLSDCIINDNHDYLLEFLEGLAVPEHCATIQDWDTAGRVYLDYIRVIKTLQDIQQVPKHPLSVSDSELDEGDCSLKVEVLHYDTY